VKQLRPVLIHSNRKATTDFPDGTDQRNPYDRFIREIRVIRGQFKLPAKLLNEGVLRLGVFGVFALNLNRQLDYSKETEATDEHR